MLRDFGFINVNPFFKLILKACLLKNNVYVQVCLKVGEDIYERKKQCHVSQKLEIV